MRQISVVAAALMLYAAPVKANDLEDAVLAETLNCVHRYIFSMMPTGRFPIDELADTATATCELSLLQYTKRFYPKADLKNIHAMVQDAAGQQIDDYIRQKPRR
jgi:hypothetical protein